MSVCKVEGCPQMTTVKTAQGYCSRHYQKWLKYRDPLYGATMELHGKRHTPEYALWLSFKQRCLNPRDKNYPNYGGRGITVCDHWASSFQAFYDDMGPRPSPDLTLDRIDNRQGYEPGNCRWATRQTQAENRRNVTFVTVDGLKVTLKEAARRLGVNYATVLYRKNVTGYSPERALGLI